MEQLCRGDCTVCPARPAPTGARCRQQSQHCDLGALLWLWLRPGAEPAGRRSKRRVVRSGARVRVTRGGKDSGEVHLQ